MTAAAAGIRDERIHPVLAGSREPGVPSLWRVDLGGSVLSVGIGPVRPGANLVRIDGVRGGTPVRIGLPGEDLVRAQSRPGTDGAWAVVDLPAGSSALLVTHGRRRALLPVDTGTGSIDTSLWTGPQGPECLSAATAELLSAQDGTGACPAAVLRDDDAAAVRATLASIAARGMRSIAVVAGSSARGAAAAAVVRREAHRWALPVVGPGSASSRSALVVVSGWSEAVGTLRAAPRRQQVWVAPWLLTPAVVGAGHRVDLALDGRRTGIDAYVHRLRSLLPGQLPTWSGYAAWRSRRGEVPARTTTFTARPADVPIRPGADAGGLTSWLPGTSLVPLTGG